MGGRKAMVTAAACVVALVGGSCAEGDGGTEPDASSTSAAPAGFMEEVRTLCAPASEKYGAFLEADDEAALEEAAADLAKAERDLASGLDDLDPPPDVAEGLDAYVDALEEYSEAERAAGEGGGVRAMKSVVAAARAEKRLGGAADAAGLPDECPPPASVDPDNNLFVAEANLGCLRLVERAGGDPFDSPRTAEEVDLMLDLSRRLAAGVAREVGEAAGPGLSNLPVKKIIRLNERHFHAIDALEKTFAGGDYGVFEKAAAKLRKISGKSGRVMLSIGLVFCAKAIRLTPL